LNFPDTAAVIGIVTFATTPDRTNMPTKAPRICGCGYRVPPGLQCACQRKREAERPTAALRGYDGKWQRESKAFLSLSGHTLCACGCGREANMIDHRVAHKGDMALFWDRANWQPFNRRCNSRKNVASEGGFGNPIV
jgi:5-methylcytosine-specific restriction protein A